jgi:aspartate kinase
MKFGGTSLEDGPAFERVADIVRSYRAIRPVVVVSAMSRVTDALLLSLRIAADGRARDAACSLEEHLERHLKVAETFGPGGRATVSSLIERARQEIGVVLNAAAVSRATSGRLLDSIASFGEILSASLLAVTLEEHGLSASYVDTRRCILTNEDHGKARPLLKETSEYTCAQLQPLLHAKKVPVLGGFIASTIGGVTTTLGRGSSDYTATLVSAVLGARETQIWTDVNGVLTADPRLINRAHTVPHLSYDEAAELTRFGASVLHWKTIQPVVEKRIPLRIRNSRAPEAGETLICARKRTSPATVKAIAHKTGITLIKLTSSPAAISNGLRSVVQEILFRHQTNVDILTHSESSFTLACQPEATLSSAIGELRQVVAAVEVRSDCGIVCCVGEGLGREASKVTKVPDVLTNIDPTLTWHKSSNIGFVSVVDEGGVESLVKRLHYAIFENDAPEMQPVSAPLLAAR